MLVFVVQALRIPSVKRGFMTLDPGARVGPYQILSPIGAGGRVEGWRADTRVRLFLVNIDPERI